MSWVSKIPSPESRWDKSPGQRVRNWEESARTRVPNFRSRFCSVSTQVKNSWNQLEFQLVSTRINWYQLNPVDGTGICASLFYCFQLDSTGTSCTIWNQLTQLVIFTCTSISQLKPIDRTGKCWKQTSWFQLKPINLTGILLHQLIPFRNNRRYCYICQLILV